MSDKREAFEKRRAEKLAEARILAHTAIAEGKVRKTWDDAIEGHLKHLITCFDVLGALFPPKPEEVPSTVTNLIDKGRALVEAAIKEGQNRKAWDDGIEKHLEELVACIDELEAVYPPTSLAEQDLAHRNLDAASDALAEDLRKKWPEGT